MVRLTMILECERLVLFAMLNDPVMYWKGASQIQRCTHIATSNRGRRLVFLFTFLPFNILFIKPFLRLFLGESISKLLNY